jgi:hypothetical protein
MRELVRVSTKERLPWPFSETAAEKPLAAAESSSPFIAGTGLAIIVGMTTI